MEIDFPYELSDDEARARLDILAQYLSNRHGIKVTWPEPTKARFSGKYLIVRIEGDLTLGDGHARFRGEDPGFLWRKKATEYIKNKLETYLDPKAVPASLPTA
jgi:hypothetical protein